MIFHMERNERDYTVTFSGSFSIRDIEQMQLSAADQAVIDRASEEGAGPHNALLALALLYRKYAELSAPQ